MKPSTKQFRATIGKIMMALALASVLGVTSIAPALAKDNDDRHDNGLHKGQQRSERDHQDKRDERNDYRDRRVPYNYSAPAYYYSEPVYAPPPVYYAPQPSPGISLFFPLDIRF